MAHAFAQKGSLFWLLNRVSHGHSQTIDCQTNLKAIYEALQLYEINNGVLPSLAMYPEDALTESDSIVKVLQQYGLDPDRLICPAAPAVVKEHGVSYLWNTAVNGTSLRDRQEPTWLLVDIQALDDELPGPHLGSYLILYTDGQVERSPMPPRSLPVEYSPEKP